MTARRRNGLDRATPGDLMTVASDHGPVPMNIAAVLVLGGGGDLDLASVGALLSARIGAVPRLRQRLVRTPLGCGRPVWVDDPNFDLAQHLSVVGLAAPGTRESLLAAAAAAACSRLDPRRPLWSARLVTGLEGGRAALVIVMHHVLADGIGGLAVLAALVDPPSTPPAASRTSGAQEAGATEAGHHPVDNNAVLGERPGHDAVGHGCGRFPQPPPSRGALAREAWASRVTALARVASGARGWVGGLSELGFGERLSALAPATSLNRPTGARRNVTMVQLSRAEVVDAAHRDGVTVNDLMLTGVTGALAAVLQRRGESPPALVLSIPVSSRLATTAADLGNQVGVLPLRVPLIASRADRLSHIARLTRAWRTGPRGESAAPMAAGFRLLAALGLFQPFINHQRFVNTFVTNVRGPEKVIDIAGLRVLEVIPVAVVPGNVGVAFDILSYADQVVVSMVADPSLVPDQDILTAELASELKHLLAPPAGTRWTRPD
jgi:diacylglycerol O-acyltransferase